MGGGGSHGVMFLVEIYSSTTTGDQSYPSVLIAPPPLLLAVLAVQTSTSEVLCEHLQQLAPRFDLSPLEIPRRVYFRVNILLASCKI